MSAAQPGPSPAPGPHVLGIRYVPARAAYACVCMVCGVLAEADSRAGALVDGIESHEAHLEPRGAE